MTITSKGIKIFTGTANPELAREITDYLGVPLGDMEVRRFKDGEIDLRIRETVRGAKVFVIQPTCSPANENLMELLVIIDALRRASAKEIAAVIPYYGYARKDRKTQPREPITAKLVANLLTAAGANRVLTMDLHAGQIQGFFDIPVDNLRALPILAEYFNQKGLKDPVIVSPMWAALAGHGSWPIACTAPWPSWTSVVPGPMWLRSCTSSAMSAGRRPSSSMTSSIRGNHHPSGRGIEGGGSNGGLCLLHPSGILLPGHQGSGGCGAVGGGGDQHHPHPAGEADEEYGGPVGGQHFWGSHPPDLRGTVGERSLRLASLTIKRERCYNKAY